MLSESAKQNVVDFLVTAINPWLIVLFGSQAKNMAQPDSDLDIAYFADTSIDDYHRFLLAQQLADTLKIEIDLIDLAAASTVMQAQIITSGIVLYCSDEAQRQGYYIKALKEYALLNEERAVIFAEIEKRGTIYG